MRHCALLLAAPLLVAAQGLLPEWELKPKLEEVIQQTQRFRPLVEKLNPAEWVKDGASPAYGAQHEALLNEIRYLETNARALMGQPDRMTLALETFTRMQSIESRVVSLSAAVRRYQNPAVADLLDGLMSETAASREIVRQYAWDLVAQREAEMSILEKEAQRCRINSTRVVTPPARPSTPPPPVAAPPKAAASPPAVAPPAPKKP
jgi:hypothetical protein